ncbi:MULTISPECIES: hypothetical protein [Ignavibacterium]|jgi:MSHA pilin protein MshD|uniref:hypothetical protein n=1 Tax=Ignavibacterium TaxID=795750 RepID=UPI0025BA1FFA|nr:MULTISPECIES: hypothetical protein [Ignavibacterium]MBI5660685.1 hypothetical protein [Ignavibacterium album]
MNLGQSLFAMGALLILSLTILRMNNNILSTDETVMDSKVGILATSIGTSLIEEASKLAFDEMTRTDPINNLLLLTPSLLLGQETPGVFDDFDDFNNYVQHDTIYSIPFHTQCSVTYINANNPDGATTNSTWHKKLTVKISSDFSRDTLELSTVYSYWYFR